MGWRKGGRKEAGVWRGCREVQIWEDGKEGGGEGGEEG